jgi:hypothetical protein
MKAPCAKKGVSAGRQHRVFFHHAQDADIKSAADFLAYKNGAAMGPVLVCRLC